MAFISASDLSIMKYAGLQLGLCARRSFRALAMDSALSSWTKNMTADELAVGMIVDNIQHKHGKAVHGSPVCM